MAGKVKAKKIASVANRHSVVIARKMNGTRCARVSTANDTFASNAAINTMPSSAQPR